MDGKQVAKFIDYYTQNGGMIEDPKYRTGATDIKPQWVEITHALDRLCKKMKPSWPN